MIREVDDSNPSAPTNLTLKKTLFVANYLLKWSFLILIVVQFIALFDDKPYK